jgi:predicted nucleotidyltransferase
MLEKRFFKENKIDEKRREQIIRRIKDYFLDKDDVVFAYLHGSFIESRIFRDIDIAIFVRKSMRDIELESDLSYELTDKTGYPVEVRIINNASIAFQMAVLRKGRLLISKANNVRTDFIENTSRRYREYSHFRNLILAA